MKLTAAQAKTATLIQQVRLAPGIPTFWLPVSYMMAIVRIESGFDETRWNSPAWGSIPAGDFATTGSVGLTQCTAANGVEIPQRFPAANLTLPQTDPYTSLCTGMLVLYEARQYLLSQHVGIPPGMTPAHFKEVIEAYNEGEGAAARGRQDLEYLVKWEGAQPDYAFLDTAFPAMG